MIRYTKPPRFSREDRRQKLTFLQGRRKNAPGNPREWDRDGGIERGGFTLGGEASPALVEQISPRNQPERGGHNHGGSMFATRQPYAEEACYASGDAPKQPGIHTAHDRLAKRVEENGMLIERLRERLGAVSLPVGPRTCGPNENMPVPQGSPVADALSQLERRLGDINRGLEYLLQDLDI